MRFASVRVVCTAGQHSSHPRSCPNYLGIFLGPRYSFSVGTGPLALTPPELDTSYLMYGVVFPLYYTTIGQVRQVSYSLLPF